MITRKSSHGIQSKRLNVFFTNAFEIYLFDHTKEIKMMSQKYSTNKNDEGEKTETWFIAELKINSSKLTAILMSSSIPSFPECGTIFFSVSNLLK